MAARVWAAGRADDAKRALATRAFEDGFHDVAVRQIEEALRDGVTPALSNQLLLMAGRCYIALERFSKAVDALQLVRPDAGTPGIYADAQYWLGRVYERQHDTPRALFSFEAAMSGAPPGEFLHEAALAAAHIYLRRDEPARAYRVLSNVLAAAGSPAPVELLFALGQAALACGAYDEARQILPEMLARSTNSVLNAYTACALGAAELAAGALTSGVERLTALAAAPAPPLVQAMARYYLGYAALMRSATNAARAYLLPNATNVIAAEAGALAAVPLREGFPVADSLLLLGQIDLTARPAEARHWLTRCIEEYPAGAVYERALLALAALAVQQGDTDQARRRLDQLAQSEQRDVRIASLLLAGDLARMASNFTQAVEAYNAAAVLASNTSAGVEARLRAAVSLYDSGAYAAAQKEFEKLIGETGAPLRDDAYIWSAWCLMQQELLPEAQARLTEYLILYPDGRNAIMAQLQLGRIATELGELERAEQYFAALATNPVDQARAEQAAYELGWVYVRQDRTDDAIAQFSRFLSDTPASELSDDVAFYLGELFFNRREYERAQRAFLTVASQYPNSPHAAAAAYWAASAALRRGAHAECLAVLSSSWPRIAASAHAPDALLLRGDCLAAQGEFIAAYRTYYAASVQSTGSYIVTEARLRMGECLLVTTNINAAISLYTELSEARHALTRARALVGLGQARLMAGDAHGALSEWLRVLYDYREFSAPAEQALVRAARLYEQLGEPDRAQQLYRLHGGAPPDATAPLSTGVAAPATNP